MGFGNEQISREKQFTKHGQSRTRHVKFDEKIEFLQECSGKHKREINYK